MSKVALTTAQSSGFTLKHQEIDLKPTTRTADPLSLTDLESIRVAGEHVPASKFGLETICGASCDTSAQ